jgi:hypothetical protein
MPRRARVACQLDVTPMTHSASGAEIDAAITPVAVGASPAINATSNRTPETATSVAGSVGVTSKSDF